MAMLGHRVVAIDPCSAMVSLARALHPHAHVRWAQDSLPELAAVRPGYDLIVLSAIWMHIPVGRRRASLDRLVALLRPGGQIYATLQLGPADPSRAVYLVTLDELRAMARAHDLTFQDLGSKSDLLGRPAVYWESVMLRKR